MGAWKSIAQRWSGRGRIRTFVVVVSLFLAQWNPAFQIVGLLLYVFGTLLHVAAKGHLIRNAQVCNEGPYGWVRHPFYASNFLIDLGLCFFSGNIWLPAAYVVLFALSYMPRILAEEETLTEKFGANYNSYKSAVPRLIPSSVPRLWRWLSDAAVTNLIAENEISRAIRLAAYPFFFAMVLEWRSEWLSVSHTSKWAWITAFGFTAFALWLAGELVHRVVEDGRELKDWPALRWLWYTWLALPLFPLIDGQPWALALEVEDHELALYTFGGVLVFGGFLSSWMFREKRNQLPFGLGLACCAFGSVAASEFVAFAPLVAVLIWIAWFLAEIHPKQAELQFPHVSLKLPAFSIVAFVAILAVMELLLETPH